MTPDIGILTGKAGRDAAFADPDNWEARSTLGNWHGSSGSLGWLEWTAFAVLSSDTQWRRKPVEKREAMRYIVRPIELRDDIVVGDPNRHLIDVRLRLPFAWNRRMARITVEEIIDKPSTSPVDAPGTVITWQEAQRRVDAGLAVETLEEESRPDSGWRSMSGFIHSPAHFKTWTYRIPLQPAQPEVVTMTAAAAEEWLSQSVRNRVTDNEGDVWQGIGSGGYAYLDNDDGTRCRQEHLPRAEYTYTPLLPAARTQVEMERELADWKPLICWAQKLTGAPLKPEPCSRYALSEINELGNRLRSALGSQKAAAAALEQERMHGCWLRNALEMCAKYFGSASVDDLRRHIAKTLRDIDETAGKESG